jgi:hypothetical protein
VSVGLRSRGCGSLTLCVLMSIGDISSISVILAICLQCLFHDACKALPAKSAFSKGFRKSKVKDRWSTTTLDVTRDVQFDIKLLCEMLMTDQNHSTWCHPISILVEQAHTSECLL